MCFPYFPANLTQLPPLDLTSDILNSTSMRVRWHHSSQGPPSDKYYLLLYNGDIDEYYITSSATSVVIYDIIPNGYYLMILIAVSGSSYGAVIKEHRHILSQSMYVNYRLTHIFSKYYCYMPAHIYNNLVTTCSYVFWS